MSLGFPTRSNTNQSVQEKKMARGLEFWIKEVEELYYLYSKIKGADQLCCSCAADMRLCFAYVKSRFSHDIAQLSLSTSLKTFCMAKQYIIPE